MPVHVILKK